MAITSNSFFLILGMHRSGTSCLTGVLKRSGVHLGKVKGKGLYNKKGYFEKEEVYNIHDQILGLNKSSWHEPPNNTIKIHPNLSQKLETITDELKTKMPCGLKDPRTLLLVDFWESLIGKEIQLIGTFRHPMAVAQSLYIRNKLPLEKGIGLWIKYNEILVAKHKKKPFPLIHYNLTNPKKYRQDVTKTLKKLGLKPNALKLRFFVSKKLEHQQENNLEVPITCKEVYEYLIKNKI